MIKVLKLGIEGNYFNILKSTYQKPTANTTLSVDKLRSSARSIQSIPKEINPKSSLEGLMLKLKLQYFGHLK